MTTYTIPLFPDSLIYKAIRVDYEDVFAIDIPSETVIKPEELVPLFFDVFPKWFMVLMHLREAIAKLIGLKTAHGIDIEEQLANFKGEKGESIALFHVFDRTEEEILTGETDKHLDFRLSFFSKPKAKNVYQVSLATTVQYNGGLGKLYFFFVKPFHRLIVPVILKRIAKRLSK
jgi:hypothetical protein